LTTASTSLWVSGPGSGRSGFAPGAGPAAPAQVAQALRRGRSRRAPQDDPLLVREDFRDLPDRNDQQQPAEPAGADGDHVRSIEPGRVPHLLDDPDPALR